MCNTWYQAHCEVWLEGRKVAACGRSWLSSAELQLAQEKCACWQQRLRWVMWMLIRVQQAGFRGSQRRMDLDGRHETWLDQPQIHRTQVPAPSRLSAISRCMRSGREAGSALSQKRSTCTRPQLSSGNMMPTGVKEFSRWMSAKKG